MKLPRGRDCRPASVLLFGKRQAGFTLFELLGIILLVSVLSLLLYDRFLGYQALAEKTAMEMTVINMRSGLQWRVGELMIEDRADKMANLLDENPIKWLMAPPPNYIGAFQNPEQHPIPGNAWYFDTRRHELVYRQGRDSVFTTDPSHAMVLRFKVTAVTSPAAIGAKAVGKVQGITLTQIAAQGEH
jgi:type II secretory pathway pseudopilin PulG